MNDWLASKPTLNNLSTENWDLVTLLSMSSLDPNSFDSQLMGSDLEKVPKFKLRRLQTELFADWKLWSK